MASRARDILVRFLGDDQDLLQSSKKVQQATGGIREGFNGIAAAVKGLVALKLADWLRSAAVNAAADSKSSEALAKILRNSTNAREEDIEAIETWIGSMTRATGVTDDELRPALNKLLIAGRSVEESQRDLAIAIDISVSRQVSLQTVVTAMARAHNGAATALSKLGIQVRNNQGEALTYDEILKKASETMGGVATQAALGLGGALEAQKVAWDEAQEAIGQKVLPQLGRLGDAFLTLWTEALGTEAENRIQVVTTLLNELVRQGIDPTANRVAAMTSVLEEMIEATQKVTEIPQVPGVLGILAEYSNLVKAQQLEQEGLAATEAAVADLQVRFQATIPDLIAVRNAVLLTGEANGLTADQIRVLISAIEAQIGIADPAVLATNRYKASIDEARGAVRDYTDELIENRNTQREATDPVFAAEKANDRLTAAHDKYTRAVIESGTGSEEARTALADLLTAQRDVESAQAGLKEAFGPDSVAALQAWGDQMGINRDALAGWINDMLLLAGLPPIALPGPPGTPVNPRTSVATTTTVTEPSPGNRRGGSELTRTVINNYNNFSVNDTADAQRRNQVTNQRQLDRLQRETVR